MKLPLPINPHDKLQAFIDWMSGRYDAPVYLVGSQLSSDNPRDIDLVAVMPDDKFCVRFQADDAQQFYLRQQIGDYDLSNWVWARDVSKQTLRAIEVTGYQVDFRVISKHEDLRYEGKNKIRVDRNPFV